MVIGEAGDDFDLGFEPEFGQAAAGDAADVKEDGVGAEGGADLGDGGGDVGGGESDAVGVGLGEGGGGTHGSVSRGKG